MSTAIPQTPSPPPNIEMATFYMNSQDSMVRANSGRSSPPNPSTPKKQGGQVRTWLRSTKATNRSESFYCIKYLCITFLSVALLYIVIVMSVGYEHDVIYYTQGELSKFLVDPDAKPKLPGQTYFLINCGLSMAVIFGSMFAVLKESPTLSISAAICFMLSILTSLSGDNSLTFSYFFSPILVVTIIGMLLLIYTSIIWSSEFETPPEIIEEYRWYLKRLDEQLGLAKMERKVQFLAPEDLKASSSRRSSYQSLETSTEQTTEPEENQPTLAVKDKGKRKKIRTNLEVHKYLHED